MCKVEGPKYAEFIANMAMLLSYIAAMLSQNQGELVSDEEETSADGTPGKPGVG